MAYTTNWKILTPQVGWQPIADTSTTATHPLGTRVKARDFGANQNGEGEFIYLLGVASTAVGSWVTYNQDNSGTSLLAANAIGPTAIAMSANVANQFGWYQIFGKAIGLALAAFADNGNVYGTATAGSVDDAIVAGDRVQNAKGASAVDSPATGMAEFEISYPFTNDALAD